MALFKVFKGNRDSLNDMPMHDGYAYFCMDDGTFHIDCVDTNNVLSRKQINANEAEKLMGYNVSTVLNSDDTEIPTSNSVVEYIIDSSDSVLAASKTYTDEEIAKFDFIKVVDALPSPGLPNRIYLVPKASEEQAGSPGVNKYDFFDEYIWKPNASGNDGVWEWITTKQLEVDLTSYITTTALNNAIIARSKLEHPVGSIYMSTVNTNPSSIFGFGTWSLIKDRFLIGAGNSYSAKGTGGASTVTLTTTQVPKVEGRISMHNGYTATNVHQVDGCFSAGITNEKYILEGSGTTGATSVGQIRFSNGGTGAAHDNMPPYLAVYMWQRTA